MQAGCSPARARKHAPLPSLPPPFTVSSPAAAAALVPSTPPQDTAPWWTKITLTQVVIVLSFTTIIASMIGTFFFVLGTGAIHFNTD